MAKESYLKNERLIELIIDITIPLIGILFFSWSIGDIYALFFLELLSLGAFTILKLMLAKGDKAGFIEKIFKILIFFSLFTIALLIIVVITGYFFNGLENQMKLSIGKNTVYILLFNQVLHFFIYLFRKQYQRDSTDYLTNQCFKRLGLLILVLFTLFLPFMGWLGGKNENYVLGVVLIIAKRLSDYWLAGFVLTNKIVEK